MADSRQIPLWTILVILVLFAVFVVNSLFSAQMELQRRTRDEWMRDQVIQRQTEQNLRLTEIRYQVEQSLKALESALGRIQETKDLVEKTEEKVDATKRTLEVIKEPPRGQPAQP